jgi:hypothetical protein
MKDLENEFQQTSKSEETIFLNFKGLKASNYILSSGVANNL